MVAAITIENLGKRYQLLDCGDEPAARYSTFREQMMSLLSAPLRRWRGGRPQAREFWALKDVSFDVAPGETVGIIGRNGAGKSTLLKILSRITRPTTGTARLHGRVGSLLEVGTGFHPELTGRENIYLNGSILGMSRREISRRFDEIVAFAEVAPFLETPVKRYSSGMYTRLAFAVAAHLEPEILVVDEVLAVGDAEFQKKCMKKMGDVAGEGRTVLFVSHNMGAVQTVCRQGVLLVEGQVRSIGPARDVVAEYLKVADSITSVPLAERRDRDGVGRFRFQELYLLDDAGNPRPFAVTGEDMSLCLRLRTPPGDEALTSPLDVAVCLRDYQGFKLTELATHFTGDSPTRAGDARELVCHVPCLPLLAGQYRIDLWCGNGSETEDNLLDAALLRVEPGNYFGHSKDVRLPRAEKHGAIMIPQRWQARRETPRP